MAFAATVFQTGWTSDKAADEGKWRNLTVAPAGGAVVLNPAGPPLEPPAGTAANTGAAIGITSIALLADSVRQAAATLVMVDPPILARLQQAPAVMMQDVCAPATV